MNASGLHDLMSGAIAMGFVAIALFFFSYWRGTKILLFGLFGFAFTLLAIERIVLAFVDAQDEFKPFVYMIRLAAFLMIVTSIVLQNRRSN